MSEKYIPVTYASVYDLRSDNIVSSSGSLNLATKRQGPRAGNIRVIVTPVIALPSSFYDLQFTCIGRIIILINIISRRLRQTEKYRNRNSELISCPLKRFYLKSRNNQFCRRLVVTSRKSNTNCPRSCIAKATTASIGRLDTFVQTRKSRSALNRASTRSRQKVESNFPLIGRSSAQTSISSHSRSVHRGKLLKISVHVRANRRTFTDKQRNKNGTSGIDGFSLVFAMISALVPVLFFSLPQPRNICPFLIRNNRFNRINYAIQRRTSKITSCRFTRRNIKRTFTGRIIFCSIFVRSFGHHGGYK